MSTIPLAIRPPDQPQGPLQQAQGAASLQDLLDTNKLRQALAPGQVQQQQQQIQAADQENQIRQLQLKDAQAGTKAMQEWDGKDWNQLPDLIQKNGGSLQAVTAAKSTVLKQQSEVQAYNTATLAQNDVKNNYLLGKLQSATAAPDENLAQSVTQAASDAVRDGYLDPQHAQGFQLLIQQAGGDPKKLRDELGLYEKGLMGQKEQFSQEIANRKAATEEITAQSRVASAGNSPVALAKLASQGDPQALATVGEIQKEAAGKSAAEAQAKQPFELQLAASRAAVEQAVKNGSAEDAGKMLAEGVAAPSEISARSNPSFLVAATKAAQKIDPNYTNQKAEADFNVAKSQTNNPFFGSAGSLVSKGGTLDQLQENYAKLGNSRIPVFNKFSDYLGYQSGNPALAGFMQTAIGAADDYAKVMGGGNGSDSSRLSVLQSFSNAHNPAQMKAAIDAARAAVGSQIESRIGNNKVLKNMYGQNLPSTKQPSAEHVPGGKASGLTEGQTGTGSDGKKYVVKGGVWVAQ